MYLLVPYPVQVRKRSLRWLPSLTKRQQDVEYHTSRCFDLRHPRPSNTFAAHHDGLMHPVRTDDSISDQRSSFGWHRTSNLSNTWSDYTNRSSTKRATNRDYTRTMPCTCYSDYPVTHEVERSFELFPLLP